MGILAVAVFVAATLVGGVDLERGLASLLIVSGIVTMILHRVLPARSYQRTG